MSDIPIKLLLVEDDPPIRRMYENAFEREGFEVQSAYDGTLVRETILNNPPDIVIMDVMMPNFDGIATLKDLKLNAKTSSIPVIMLSANDDPAVIKKALDLGAAHYLVKSNVEPSEVVAIIRIEAGKIWRKAP
ncbi:MAG: response regulator [Patescibacteria group bacterium]